MNAALKPADSGSFQQTQIQQLVRAFHLSDERGQDSIVSFAVSMSEDRPGADGHARPNAGGNGISASGQHHGDAEQNQTLTSGKAEMQHQPPAPENASAVAALRTLDGQLEACGYDAGHPWRLTTRRGLSAGDDRTLVNPDGSTSIIVSEYEVQLESALAEIRDMFPIPEHGRSLLSIWASAMDEPLSVPGFVRAALGKQCGVSATAPMPAILYLALPELPPGLGAGQYIDVADVEVYGRACAAAALQMAGHLAGAAAEVKPLETRMDAHSAASATPATSVAPTATTGDVSYLTPQDFANLIYRHTGLTAQQCPDEYADCLKLCRAVLDADGFAVQAEPKGAGDAANDIRRDALNEAAATLEALHARIGDEGIHGPGRVETARNVLANCVHAIRALAGEAAGTLINEGTSPDAPGLPAWQAAIDAGAEATQRKVISGFMQSGGTEGGGQ